MHSRPVRVFTPPCTRACTRRARPEKLQPCPLDQQQPCARRQPTDQPSRAASLQARAAPTQAASRTPPSSSTPRWTSGPTPRRYPPRASCPRCCSTRLWPRPRCCRVASPHLGPHLGQVLAFATADAAYMSGGYELSLPSAPARTLHRQAWLASRVQRSQRTLATTGMSVGAKTMSVQQVRTLNRVKMVE